MNTIVKSATSATPAKKCYYCGQTHTSLWRKFEGHICCNACGLYMKSNKQPRPEWLKKRVHERKNSKEEKRCHNCQSTESVLWRRDSEGNINCNRCGIYQRIHNRPRPVELKKKLPRKSLSFLGPIQRHSRSMSDSGFEFEPKTEITAEMRILPPLTKSRMHKRTTSLNFEIAMVKRVQKKQLPSLASVLKSIPGNRKLHGRVPQPVYSQLTAPFTYQKTSPTTTYPVYSPRPSPVPSSNAYPSPVFHQLPPSPQKGLDWLANVASNETAKMSPMISPKSSVSSPQFHKQSLKMSLASILS